MQKDLISNEVSTVNTKSGGLNKIMQQCPRGKKICSINQIPESA